MKNSVLKVIMVVILHTLTAQSAEKQQQFNPISPSFYPQNTVINLIYQLTVEAHEAILGSWKTISYVHCNTDLWAIKKGESVQTPCGYNLETWDCCDKDDLKIFHSDKIFEYNLGQIFTEDNNEPLFGQYQISCDRKELSILSFANGFEEKIEVLELTPQTLVLKYTNGDIETLQKM